MKMLDEIHWFMDNTVNLNQTRIDLLDKRVSTVTTFLVETSEVGEEVEPQGSYAHGTIIKPPGTKDFDADVLLRMPVEEGTEAKDYIAELYKALCGSDIYKGMIRRRARCVTIDYAGDFHIDVVPFIVADDGSFITNRDDNKFELTDPEGFNDWLTTRNHTANGHLVHAIRLFKFVRDFKLTFSIPSVILTTLLGECVDSIKPILDEHYYGDLPTAFVHIVNDLDDYLQANPYMPVITIPGSTAENLTHRWDQERYSTFRDKVHQYAGWVIQAYEETDYAKSLTAWQRVLGDSFKTPPSEALVAKSNLEVAANEQFIDDLFDKRVRPNTLRIGGRIRKKNGFRSLDLSQRGNRVEKRRAIDFTIRDCDVQEPYDLYWKVRNFGDEASNTGQLRGEIVRGRDSHYEETAYHGTHYVDCYVVKDDVCVATDRQIVKVI